MIPEQSEVIYPQLQNINDFIKIMKNIFFSWQADTPSKTGRNFLKDVLEEVCKRIATDTKVNEALRSVEVDSDTQGVAGQPPIVDTIFKKIDAAGVFLADMTFTGKRPDNRPTPNPNVLIEYGWALKSLSHERVICVMNETYGEPTRESLPFDLSHVRWPIRYSLPEDASHELKTKEKQNLVIELTKAIRASLGTIPAVSVKQPDPFPLAHAKTDRARFRGPNESLGFEDDFPDESGKDVFLSGGPAIWFRLMPLLDPSIRWPAHELKAHLIEKGQMNLTPLMNGAGGYGLIRAADGVGIYRATSRNKENGSIQSDSIAFAFETGEIWSTDTAQLAYSGNDLPFIEKIYAECIQHYACFLQSLGLEPPYRWIAGITGVMGRHLKYPVQKGYHRIDSGPRCASDFILAEGEYDGKQSAMIVLMPFFKKIFEQCGLARPTYLPQE